MGQVDRSPVAVVEGGVRRRKEIAGLLEIAAAAAAEAEVFGRFIGGDRRRALSAGLHGHAERTHLLNCDGGWGEEARLKKSAS